MYFKTIKKQLVDKNKKLNEVTENALWLKDNYGQNDARNAEVDRRLENVEQEMDNLKEKLAEKNAQLELILYKKQSYELSMDKFMAWCVSVDKTMRSQEAVSLRYPEIIIQQRVIQVNTFECLCGIKTTIRLSSPCVWLMNYYWFKSRLSFPQDINHEVKNAVPLYEYLKNAGFDYIDGEEPGVKRDMARQRVTNITKYWKLIHRKTADRSEKLNEVFPRVRDYHDSVTSFVPWLTTAERDMQAFGTVSFDQSQLTKQRAELKVSEVLIIGVVVPLSLIGQVLLQDETRVA